MKIANIYDVKKENKSQGSESSKENAREYGKSDKLLRDKPSEKEWKRNSSRRGWTRKFWSFERRCSISVGQIITNLEAFKSLYTQLL